MTSVDEQFKKYRIENNDFSVYYHIPDYVLEAKINRLIVEAKLGEFKNFPVTRSYRGYIEGRIEAFTKELGSLDDK